MYLVNCTLICLIICAASLHANGKLLNQKHLGKLNCFIVAHGILTVSRAEIKDADYVNIIDLYIYTLIQLGNGHAYIVYFSNENLENNAARAKTAWCIRPIEHGHFEGIAEMISHANMTAIVLNDATGCFTSSTVLSSCLEDYLKLVEVTEIDNIYPYHNKLGRFENDSRIIHEGSDDLTLRRQVMFLVGTFIRSQPKFINEYFLPYVEQVKSGNYDTEHECKYCYDYISDWEEREINWKAITIISLIAVFTIATFIIILCIAYCCWRK